MAESRTVLGQIERLKRHLEPELTDVDVARLVRGAAQRRERRRVRRSLRVGLGLGAAATAALSLFLHLPQRQGAAVATSRPAVVSGGGRASSAPGDVREAQSIVLADASRALALEPGTEFTVEQDSPALVQLRLDRGRARFDVTPRTERSFEVRAGKVIVKVVGTVFDVEVVADRIGVSVEKGMVAVDWGRGQKRLSAGEHGWFPPVMLSDGAEAAGPDTAAHESGGGKGTSSQRAAAAPPTEPNVQDLFAQVDSERARGNPARAAELLKQILREYPEDPRASLAAFTLGRVLLNDLARPREAAAAFHQVREKAPASQFAEDALAREVDAWKRASEPERARALATQYLERYPSGRHAQRVRILLGLK